MTPQQRLAAIKEEKKENDRYIQNDAQRICHAFLECEEKSIKETLAWAREKLEKIMKEEPYPEDIFPPYTTTQLQAIHILLEKNGTTLDRLSADIGRRGRRGWKEELEAFVREQLNQ